MMKCTSRYLVPLTFGAMAACLLSLAGCGREEASAPPKPVMKADPPSVYMKDKDFRRALDEKRTARKEVLGIRERLLNEMEKRVDAMRAKLAGAGGTVTDEAVKKELEKDPEWNSLIKKIEDANAAFDDNRKATTKIVSERLAPRPQKPLK